MANGRNHSWHFAQVVLEPQACLSPDINERSRIDNIAIVTRLQPTSGGLFGKPILLEGVGPCQERRLLQRSNRNAT